MEIVTDNSKVIDALKTQLEHIKKSLGEFHEEGIAPTLLVQKIVTKVEQLQRQNDELQADAKRYQRLAVLVNAGEWFTGYSTVKDSYGLCDETNMDDKAMMDKYLDKPEVIDLAESWKRIELRQQSTNDGSDGDE